MKLILDLHIGLYARLILRFSSFVIFLNLDGLYGNRKIFTFLTTFFNIPLKNASKLAKTDTFSVNMLLLSDVDTLV